jgi:hypothetical protein
VPIHTYTASFGSGAGDGSDWITMQAVIAKPTIATRIRNRIHLFSPVPLIYLPRAEDCNGQGTIHCDLDLRFKFNFSAFLVGSPESGMGSAIQG